MMGVLTRPIWKTSTCLMQPSAALPCPDHVASLDEVGLKVGGQRLEPDRVVVVVAWHGMAWRGVEPDGWCRRCGWQGAPRESVVRRLAHEPLR